ncbi:MAG: hypothetical protein WC787_03700 [Patescibacteria group bacterium]
MDELLRRIEQEQQADGGFITCSFFDPTAPSDVLRHRATFTVSWILDCLNSFKGDRLIRDRAAAFLVAQRSDHWSFNYWPRHSDETSARPYPDDMDDTFCALTSLFEYAPSSIDGAALAKIVLLLTATETQEGGPYRTWLVPPDAPEAWKDIDIAVNANIGCFLAGQNVDLEHLNAYIAEAIRSRCLTSPYYPSTLPILFFLSRWVRGETEREGLRNALDEWTMEHLKPNSLELALAGLTAFHLGDKEQGLSFTSRLREVSMEDICQPYAFCIDPSQDGKIFYAGSPALTAAFTLALFAESERVTEQTEETKMSPRLVSIDRQIEDRIAERFAGLPAELSQEAMRVYGKIRDFDTKKRIPLMPALMTSGLLGGEMIPDETLVRLGMANVYGWMAYTVYDDLLDGEGDPHALSTANSCLREVTSIYAMGFPEPSFAGLVKEVMDNIDGANQWELVHCRDVTHLPDYGDYEMLALRSFGHALGPLAILYTLGYATSSPEMTAMNDFFKHYFIARQMNDDAHDWQEDLRRGQVNSVAAMILKGSTIEADRFEELEVRFWHEVVQDVAAHILKHVGAAREALTALPIKQTDAFEDLLAPVENAAQDAIHQQRETLAFLSTYTG